MSDELIREFQSHYDTLRAFVRRRVHSVELAADILQDCYLRIAGRDRTVRIDNPLSFFYRIAGNLIIDRIRERDVRERHADPAGLSEQLPDQAPLPDVAFAARQRLELLIRAVDELPPRCREVFLLRKVELLEFDEIAKRLRISRNMVEKHLRKALLHFQSRLAEHD